MNRLLIFVFCLLPVNNFCSAQIMAQNDSLFSKQKKLFEKINVFEAWEITRGSSDIIIGCIETGFDFYHPYLRNQLMPGYYSDGVYHTETYQTLAHGTLVTSLMVANPQNKNGMLGLTPECKVMTASIGMIENPRIRVFQEIMKNNPDLSDIEAMIEANKEISKDTITAQQFNKQWRDFVTTKTANSIVYLTDKGVKVINMSMYTFIPELNEAFEYARKNDVLIVVGAGNNNKEIPDVLTNKDNIIIVGATNQNDTRWTMTKSGVTQGSNWGELLDVCAPSENIVVCKPSDNRFYKISDGPTGIEDMEWNKDICHVIRYGATSSATPMVTSLAALIYSIAPDMTAKEVKQAIIKGCDDIGAEGFDIYTGHGRINFGKTISLVKNCKTE